MSSPLSYPYASGDLLEERNTYFYSAFQGRAFLDAWRRQRESAMFDLAHAAEVGMGPNRIAVDGSATQPTDALLDSIHRRLTDASDGTFDRQTLDRLVQRFEVSKRLHGEYDAHWRPVVGADYRSLERYILFAEILDLSHARSGALPYLNALLKVDDTLTALRDRLSAEQRKRLQHVLAHERDHVERLAWHVGERQ